MKFDLMVNEAIMKSKEQCIECSGAIKSNNRRGFRSYKTTVNEKELENLIKEGHTIAPAVLDENQPLCNKYFKYQQLFAIDIDNESSSCKGTIADETYYMTHERIKEICNQYGISPILIHETFSSKPDWKKYRVLFVTESPISDKEQRRIFLMSLMKIFAVKGIHIADTHCTDEGRVFYAGHTIIELNTDVPVSPDAFIEAAKDINVQDIQAKKDSTSKTSNKVTNNNSKPACKKAAANEMIEAIMNHDINSYKELLSNAVNEAANADVDWCCEQSSNNGTINCMHLYKDYCPEITQNLSNPVISMVRDDTYEFTSKLPLDLLLGLTSRNAFSCILPNHDDNHPSAYINQLADGSYVYNCWGCIGEGKYLDVLDVFSILMSVDIGKALKFILEAVGLEIESVWQKEQREIIEANISYIDSDYLKKHRSILYNDLKRANALGVLKFLLRYAKDNLTYESLTRDGRPTFFLSVRQAAQLMSEDGFKGSNKSSINKKINLLCRYGFFNKVLEQEIPSFILQRAKDVASKNSAYSNVHYDHRQDFLYIPVYDAHMFIRAENVVREDKESAVRRGGQSREQHLRAYGKDAADSIYTQDTHKGHSKKSDKFYKKYSKTAKILITSNGITSEREILNKMKGYSYREKKKLSDQCLPQLLRENGYSRIRVNKETRAEYSIPSLFHSKEYVLIKAC